jgi:prepilin-type N-terminal cleavage/methylation domain-containing protein/prepilin-type processing-associated H-X9-DG protein
MSSLRRAFTLIELLLVVSIISLLIAILLPSLGKSREAARETLCRSNMSQIGRGTINYAGEYRGEFPANRFRVDQTLNQHVTWRWLVVKGKYVGDGDLWLCPGPAPNATGEQGVNIHGSQCVGDVAKANYAYNGTAFWRFAPNGAPDGSHPYPDYGIPNEKSELTLRNIRRPGQTFIILETRAFYPDIGDWAKNWADPIIGYWHRRGANWAMVDGSVRWSKLMDTANPDCWWHNFVEPQNMHIDWDSQVPAIYK